MAKYLCVIFCSLHLLILSFSTYMAAEDIKSILITGAICSLSGLVAGIVSFICWRPILGLACLSTFVLAVLLVVLEAFYLNLGPQKAAYPFCVVFILNQVVSTLTILVQLNLLSTTDGKFNSQITLKTLLIAMCSFSLFFAIAHYLLKNRSHDHLMGISLGLFGLTVVGLIFTITSLVIRQSGIAMKRS